VIIFVTLHNGRRYAFVGDLVWQLEGITQREERPWFSRNSDSDAAGTRENPLRLIAIKERLPELIIIPAHDMRAFAELPTLSQASGETVGRLEPTAHNQSQRNSRIKAVCS
jgi:N-acyl homoserine lactone hydrolase